MTRGTGELLLGEWACLGVVAVAPTHGFAVAQRLRPEGDLGRVWSLSRALTYRALDHQSTMGAYVGRLAQRDGKGVMVDWVYRDGLSYLPPDEEVKKLRPAE